MQSPWNRTGVSSSKSTLYLSREWHSLWFTLGLDDEWKAEIGRFTRKNSPDWRCNPPHVPPSSQKIGRYHTPWRAASSHGQFRSIFRAAIQRLKPPFSGIFQPMFDFHQKLRPQLRSSYRTGELHHPISSTRSNPYETTMKIEVPSGKPTNNYGKIRHFWWENSLFEWPC